MHGARNGGASKCRNLGCQEQPEQPGAPDDQNVFQSMVFGACMKLEMEGCLNVEIWGARSSQEHPRSTQEHPGTPYKAHWDPRRVPLGVL